MPSGISCAWSIRLMEIRAASEPNVTTCRGHLPRVEFFTRRAGLAPRAAGWTAKKERHDAVVVPLGPTQGANSGMATLSLAGLACNNGLAIPIRPSVVGELHLIVTMLQGRGCAQAIRLLHSDHAPLVQDDSAPSSSRIATRVSRGATRKSRISDSRCSNCDLSYGPNGLCSLFCHVCR